SLLPPAGEKLGVGQVEQRGRRARRQRQSVLKTPCRVGVPPGEQVGGAEIVQLGGFRGASYQFLVQLRRALRVAARELELRERGETVVMLRRQRQPGFHLAA